MYIYIHICSVMSLDCNRYVVSNKAGDRSDESLGPGSWWPSRPTRCTPWPGSMVMVPGIPATGMMGKSHSVWLWLLHSHGIDGSHGPNRNRWIDGLPIKNDDFPRQTVSHNQRVETISIALMLTPGPEMFDTWWRHDATFMLLMYFARAEKEFSWLQT